MGIVSAAPNLPKDGLLAFYTTDAQLSDGPILILYGPSSTTVATSGSSRIQCHVFTSAGFQSYPRLAISPSSSLYSAVQQLAHVEQGDEISRALAYCLFKYFSELSDGVKDAWVERSLNKSKPSTALRLFSDAHAAQLTSRMRRLENTAAVVGQLQLAFSTRSTSFLDVDIVLPDGSIKHEQQSQDSTTTDGTSLSFGSYAALIEAFGEWAFVPTSRVRRAPSRANSTRRSPVFSRAQKEMLRREMCELLDTEESYVVKVHELVHQVASDFRQKARDRAASSKSPSEATLATIFPQSLDEILRVNTDFLQAARTILEETENEAISDIEATNGDGVRQGTANKTVDPTGAVAFAQCLVDWFPSFSKCYSDYMTMHSRFAQNIRLMMSDGTSSFARRVHETGEQRLTSLLIEPIQRLPRYALYVDNIAHQLPAAHPATRNLLKAKDIIRDICAQDQGGVQTAKITDFLQAHIPTWPQSCRPIGRLVTAADLVELNPPFTFPGSERTHLIVLVFSDSMVLLERDQASRVTAKILSSELESSSSSAETIQDANLQFVEMVPLAHVDVLELGSGSGIQTMPSKAASQTSPQMDSRFKRSSLSNTVKVFQVGGIYEGKVSRFVKDLTKARVESRYPESVRESSRWSAREYESCQACLGLFSAVVEESVLSQSPASVRIVVDRNKCKQFHLPTKETNDISAFVTPEDNGFFRLEVDALGQHGTRDLVQAAELTPVLCKRLNNALQMQSDMRSQSIPVFLLDHNEAVLRLFGSTPERNSIRSIGRSPHGSRSQSPVKAVANIFSSSRDTKPLPAPPSATSVFADIVNLRPNLHNRSRPEVIESHVERTPSKARIVRDSNIGPAKLSIEALEQTFDSYILALHARKGNVVGRSLGNRKFADEASVNELYNVLLDEPQNAIAHEQAAQTPVDVLFASFEKFLNNAWAEQMGPLLSSDDLAQLRSGADTLSPMDYEELLQQKIEELAPQNQRALLAMIGMLIDLMEGTPNDSDRGALMMTVTEIVVRDKNAQEMMPIFDRLVEDYDVISGWGACSGRATPVQGSMTSNATRSTHTTSFSSKASSFSKRLGRGILSRQNSKVSDTASKFGSIKSWNFPGKSPTDSSSKNNLDRARSVELLSHSASNSRPVSRDRPTFLNVFDSSPASQLSKLDFRPNSLKADAASQAAGTPRSKRRSSLSDVNSLPQVAASPLTWTPRAHDVADKQGQARPTTPKIGTVDRPTTADTSTSVPPFFASSNKINAHGQTATSSPTKCVTKVTILGRSQSPALLPVPRGVLSERPSSGNTPTPPQSPERAMDGSSPRKLRAPSPTKFSERFQGQQDAMTSARTLLKGEVGKLAQDMAALGMDTPTPTGVRLTSQAQSKDQKAMNNVATRLRALEAKIPHLTGGLERSLATFKTEMTASAQESERKIRLLESDLKDANAINEELFSSTQSELTRIFKRVKEGDGVATLKESLKDSQDEAARLRKENQRMRREILGLRAKIGDA